MEALGCCYTLCPRNFTLDLYLRSHEGRFFYETGGILRKAYWRFWFLIKVARRTVKEYSILMNVMLYVPACSVIVLINTRD